MNIFGQIKFKLLLLVILVLSLVGQILADSESIQSDSFNQNLLTKPKQITLVHSTHYPPLFYLDENGRSQGIMVDYWRLWSKKSGIKIVFEPYPWFDCMERIRSGQSDMIPGIFYTAERDAYFDFSQSFMEVKTTIFVNKSIIAENIADLLNRQVGVIRGDRAEDFLKQYSFEKQLKSYSGSEDVIKAASNGEIDAFVMDYPVALFFLKKYNLSDSFESLQTIYVGKFCAAVKEGNQELLIHINEGIERINEAEIIEIYNRCLPGFAKPSPKVISLFLVIGIILIATIILIHNVILRTQVHKRTNLIEKAEKKYRRLIEDAYEGIAVSRDDKFVFVSPGMIRITGYSMSELVDSNRYLIVHPDDKHILESRINHLEMNEFVSTTYQMRVITNVGETKWVQVSSTTIEWEDELAELEFMIDITDLKIAQESLVKADVQLKSIVNVSPVPIIVTKLEDGEILYANDNLGTLIGYKKEELIGQQSPNFYYDINDRKRLIKILKRDGKVSNFEVRIKKRDGSFFWSLFSLAIAKLSGEKVIMGSLIDISERRKSEEKLQLYRQIYLNSDDGIVILDANSSYIESNPVHLYRSGFTKEELKEKGVDGILGPKAGEIFRDGIASESSIRREVTTSLKDGSEITIDISAFPIKNTKGEITNFASIGRDITEQKKVQDALSFSEEKFRSLVENANDIIYAMNSDGIFSYISPQLTKLTGFAVSEFIGKPMNTFFHPDEAVKCSEWIDMGMPKDESSDTGYMFRGKTKDGGWRWYTTNASVIKDEDGNIIEAVGIAHDITEMKKMLEDIEKANHELLEAQTQLVQSAKMASLGQLVAGIAHEINTPVGAVSSMHDTLMRGIKKLKDNMAPILEKNDVEGKKLNSIMNIIEDANKVIKSGTERVTTIVKRLRSFARLDEAELKTVDIHEGLEDTLALIQHEIKHDITLKKEYGNLPFVSCFPGRLNQVFLNILNNARHAIPDKGEVTIKTYQKGKVVFISISDDGMGISSQNLKKIFDPGFTTKGVGVGTGLGLSICFQIMKDHHGTIDVESEIGKGTTFIISLPTNLDEVISNNKKE